MYWDHCACVSAEVPLLEVEGKLCAVKGSEANAHEERASVASSKDILEEVQHDAEEPALEQTVWWKDRCGFLNHLRQFATLNHDSSFHGMFPLLTANIPLPPHHCYSTVTQVSLIELRTVVCCRDVKMRISGYGALAVLFSFIGESMPIFSAMSLHNGGLGYSSTEFAVPAGVGGVWLMISSTLIYPRVNKSLGNQRYERTRTLLNLRILIQPSVCILISEHVEAINILSRISRRYLNYVH